MCLYISLRMRGEKGRKIKGRMKEKEKQTLLGDLLA